MEDDVLVRRERISVVAKRVRTAGYLCIAVACGVFAYGVWQGLTSGVTAIITGMLVASMVLLPPAIIAGYAVNAANREDRKLAAEAARKAAP